jgi:K(+)-stimulated pyrophosphate-energized sodium pump
MLVFLFSSLAIRAVGTAGGAIIEEVRRQFRADPGIMAGTSRPDYGRAVDITAKAALREMILPGVLAVGLPVAVGLIFRFVRDSEVTISLSESACNNSTGEYIAGACTFTDASGWLAVAGVLIVGTIGGILMATVLNNGGGAWDNAKKFIESGGLKEESGTVLGKGSEPHKAAVVGDTVGDPFKDTAGPSLHVLIKLLATITLVLAPLFIVT